MEATMNKKTALKVLAEVQEYVGDADPKHGPQMMDNDHEGLPEGAWSICYEGGGPDSWAVSFRSQVPGVHCEAILGCILGVYDA
jgi:hypothetical protein